MSNDALSKIKRSSQTIDNLSFDEAYLQSAVLLLTENEAGTAIGRQKEIATEETQLLVKDELSSIALGVSPLVVTDAISELAFDINASPFSATTDISNDFIFDSLELNFSTTQSKTVTITTNYGTVIYSDTNSYNNITLPFDLSYDSDDNLTVTVTQTSGACLMDCILKIKQGSQSLSGNPVLAAGTNHIGSVAVDNLTNGTQIAQMYGKTGDTTFQVPRIDTSTHSLQTIDYAHHEVHSGSHFFIIGVQDLPINDVLDFTWVMPDTTKWTHFVWNIESESETAWYIYENAIATNALANAVTPLNSNRNSSSVSGTTMRYEVQTDLATANTDTNVTTATLLKSGILGSGKGNGGYEGREGELILKQGATYCFRAIATAAGYINFDMEWYEHTNKSA